LVHAVIFFVFPFLGAGLGTISVIEVMGKSWHRPNLITRSLGGVGLLVTGWIGIQWLIVALFYALYVALAISDAFFAGLSLNGMGR